MTGPYQSDKQWLEILIALDQMGNALQGGSSRETISSTIGKGLVQNRVVGLGGIMTAAGHLIDWLDANHCLDAIDWDHGETFEACFGQYTPHRSDGRH